MPISVFPISSRQALAQALVGILHSAAVSPVSYFPIKVSDVIAGEKNLLIPPELLSQCAKLSSARQQGISHVLHAFEGNFCAPVTNVNPASDDDLCGDFEFQGPVPGNPDAHHVVFQCNRKGEVTYISLNRENGESIVSIGQFEEARDRSSDA